MKEGVGMLKIAFRDENKFSIIGMKEILELCIPQKKKVFRCYNGRKL